MRAKPKQIERIQDLLNMSKIIPNTFITYELTEEEAIQGAILTVSQKQNIQNHRANIAEEKLSLDYDVNNPQAFLQKEAHLKGQLDVLNWLLDSSEAAEDLAIDNIRNQSGEEL